MRALLFVGISAVVVGLAVTPGCTDDSDAPPTPQIDAGVGIDAGGSDAAKTDATGGHETGPTDSGSDSQPMDAPSDTTTPIDAADASDGACTMTALQFSSDPDTVVVPNSTSMNFGAAGTIEMWLYRDPPPDSGAVGGCVFDKWLLSQEDKFFGVSATGELVTLLYKNPGVVSFNSSAAVTTGHWTHIAMSYDSTSTRVYVDGTKVGEVAGAVVPANSTGTIQIGHVTRDTPQLPVKGAYSDMRLSNIARYTASFTPAARLATDGNTQALWKLDDGTGTTANDSSANNNDGTITGATWVQKPCR